MSCKSALHVGAGVGFWALQGTQAGSDQRSAILSRAVTVPGCVFNMASCPRLTCMRALRQTEAIVVVVMFSLHCAGL